jgi:hypothetical protein
LLGLASLFVAAAVACSSPTGSPYEGGCPAFQLLATTPVQSARDVSPFAPIVFRFSDFPDPDTTLYPTVTVTSGLYRYTARTGVDLARRSVVVQTNNGLPAGVQISAFATPDLRSLHGCPINRPSDRPPDLPVLLQFRTAETATRPPVTPLPKGTEVVAFLASRCAGGCHAEGDDSASGCLDAPAAGLSLCASQALTALRDGDSRERPTEALLIPHDSARSYLVRKLLGAPPAPARHGDTTDEDVAWLERWIEGGTPDDD